jgi:RNA-binding protein PNO1
MVVAHVDQSTSASKNRRSIGKKKARTAGTTLSQQVGDEEMASVIPPSNSGHTAEEDDLMIEVDPTSALEASSAPAFLALPASATRSALKSETRRVPIPPHRMTPIKKDWINIFSPLTEILGLQVRMNVQRRCVEIRVRTYLSPGNPHSSHPADIKSNQRNWCSSKRS